MRLSVASKLAYGCQAKCYSTTPQKALVMPSAFFVKEGLLEESRNHYKITFKGKALIDNGGFVAKYRRERIQFYSVIIATVVGVISLVVSIVAIFL